MWYIILTLVLGIYLTINLVLPKIVTGTTSSYIIQPILWITLAIITILIAKKEGLTIHKFKKIRRWQLGKEPYQAALLIGGFHVALLIIAGLLFGFGNSPNIITATTFFIFLIYITTPLIGMEFARSYFLKKSVNPRKNITLIIALVALLFMIIQISITDILLINPNEPVTIIKFLGENIIPLLAISLFASYLAYYGGAIASISYLLVIKSFEMYSPILPDIDWLLKAFIYIIVPTMGFLLIQSSIQETTLRTRLSRKLKRNKDPTLSWLAIAVVALFIVLFSFGYFGIQPSIISSGSMSPSLETGDIVVIDEIDISEIQIGDIIQYEMNGFDTVHRVYDITEDENGKMIFITKGDANNQPDIEPVNPDQIKGKSIFTLPKIGWVPLIIKSLVNKIGVKI